MRTVIVEQPLITLTAPDATSNTSLGGELYEPIPHPNTIRLLEIEAGKPASPIRCHLFFSRLDSSSPPPSYEAISYVWGDLATRGSVKCNGTALSITTNLAAALRRFRSPTEGRVVWADGICINQADDREKGHQVRLMRLIYKRAARVLVWLGEPASDEQPVAAFSALCALANHQTLAHVQDGTPSPPAAWDKRSSSISSLLNTSTTPYRFGVHRRASSEDSISSVFIGINTTTAGGERRRTSALLADLWAALEPFFALPWFRRVWVIQEIALSSESTKMYWGSSTSPSSTAGGASIAWAIVARATDRIVALKHRLPLHRLPGALHAHLMGNLWQAEQRRGSGGNDQRISFEELYADTLALSFVASDPRDRVYGLLGIPTRETEPDDGVLYLEPDYSVNLVGVYVRLFQKRRQLAMESEAAEEAAAATTTTTMRTTAMGGGEEVEGCYPVEKLDGEMDRLQLN